MSSPGFLSVGQTTPLKVDKPSSGMNYTSTSGQAGKTGSLSQTPITITSATNSTSPSSTTFGQTYGVNSGYSSNQLPSQQGMGSPAGMPAKTAGKTAKDFLLSNDLEGRAETQHMRRSQQVVMPGAGNTNFNDNGSMSSKFDTRLTNPNRPDVFPELICATRYYERKRHVRQRWRF
jgi:hypothetical protein